jgi:hypothetical protein
VTTPPRTHGGFREGQVPLGAGAANDGVYDPARDEMLEIVNRSRTRTGVAAAFDRDALLCF